MAQQYFEKHDIQGLMDNLVKQMAKECPEDPKQWLASKLGGAHTCNEPSVVYENGHPAWQNPSCMQGAKITKNHHVLP